MNWIFLASQESSLSGGWYYMLEYLPLIQDAGGVRLYDAAMAFERFVPADGPSGAISDAENAYIASLVEHAKSLSRTPVLTATRSLGRLAGMKAAFPGLHILLYRNLFHQWCCTPSRASSVIRIFSKRSARRWSHAAMFRSCAIYTNFSRSPTKRG